MTLCNVDVHLLLTTLSTKVHLFSYATHPSNLLEDIVECRGVNTWPFRLFGTIIPNELHPYDPKIPLSSCYINALYKINGVYKRTSQ